MMSGRLRPVRTFTRCRGVRPLNLALDGKRSIDAHRRVVIRVGAPPLNVALDATPKRSRLDPH
jgi:hypothetical protein